MSAQEAMKRRRSGKAHCYKRKMYVGRGKQGALLSPSISRQNLTHTPSRQQWRGFLLARNGHDSALAARMEGVRHSEVFAAFLLSTVQWGALAADARCR